MSDSPQQRKRASTLTISSPPSEPSKWIGFDLDMTLIRYKLENLLPHIFNAAIEHLIVDMGYPDWLRQFDYCRTGLLRGVILDKENGNFMLIDSNRRVRVAYHGTLRMSESEIAKSYPEPINFVGLQTFRFWASSSHFELPYLYLLQLLIMKVDQHELVFPLHGNQTGQHQAENFAPSSCPSFFDSYPDKDKIQNELLRLRTSPYYQLITDMHTTINFNFGNFNDGYYFPPFHTDKISKYIYQRYDIKDYLLKLKEAGQRVFLLTNSSHHYSNALMNFAFGEDWRNLFDLIIYRSKKPHFFLLDYPFYALVDPSLEGETAGLQKVEENTKLELCREYYGGNLKKLKEDLLGESQVIYVGDELFGDIVAPGSYAGWQTIAIVEELQVLEDRTGFQVEIYKKNKYQHDDSDISTVVNGTVSKLQQTFAQLDVDGWGNYFFTDLGHLTYWGYLMHNYADISIPCVKRLAQFDVGDKFLPHHPMSQQNAKTKVEEKIKASAHLSDLNEKLAYEDSNYKVPTTHHLLENMELIKALKEWK